MKNLTITLSQDVADWLRVEAAKADQSMSAYVSTLLESQMGRGKDQVDLLEGFLSGAGFAGIGTDLPKREDLYDRPALRRHQHSDLRARSGQSGEAHGVSGFAEADNQESFTHVKPAKPQ